MLGRLAWEVQVQLLQLLQATQQAKLPVCEAGEVQVEGGEGGQARKGPADSSRGITLCTSCQNVVTQSAPSICNVVSFAAGQLGRFCVTRL